MLLPFSQGRRLRWFKNLSLYRFLQPFAWTAEELDARLAARAFRPTADLEAQFTGWVSPLGEDRPPGVHAAGGYLAFCARTEEKVMPAAAVRDAVSARVREIEQREGRPVRGRRRAENKDDVNFEMLPRAFTRSRANGEEGPPPSKTAPRPRGPMPCESCFSCFLVRYYDPILPP